MLNHECLADIILESAAQLLVPEHQYIYCGELLCLDFWIFPAIDSFLAFVCRFMHSSAVSISSGNILVAES